MTYINITKFVLINQLEKDHSMIETPRLKNVVIFIQTIYFAICELQPIDVFVTYIFQSFTYEFSYPKLRF